MAVDPYAPCPCGSGKKLKFCCSDLVGDIEKITKLVDGDQPHAALKHVTQLLEKEPNRTSLLDIRAMLELSLEEFDAAEQTIARLLKVDPESPSAHAEAAILAAARKRTDEAVAKLQDALERSSNDMQERVFEAIGAVGHSLLIEGDVVAARAHLTLYASVAPAGDERALELLLQLNLQSGLPLLLRDNLRLQDPPERFAEANKTTFREGNRLAHGGLWRRAEAEYAKLLNEANPQPPVVYNLALVRGWLGDAEQFAAGLHRYARLSVPWDDAVEAEALAQLTDPTVKEPQLATVRLEYSLSNEDTAAERLASDKRIDRYELDPQSLDEDEVTRPRSTYLLLDRPIPAADADLGIDDVPNTLAFLSLYGKRTDRDAQLTVTTNRDQRFDEAKSLVREILGDVLGECSAEDVLVEKSLAGAALTWRWRLPDDMPLEQRRALVAQRRRKAVLDDWTATPLAVLAGASPQDAAARPDLRIPLAAVVLLIEQNHGDLDAAALFQELREQLRLPLPEPIDPDTAEPERLPLVRIPRLELDKIAIDRVFKLFNRAMLSGASAAATAVAREIISRDSPDFDAAPAYRFLIRSEPDYDQALSLISRARRWAEQAGQPIGEWVLSELEIHIALDDAASVDRSLNEIAALRVKEPGIAEAAYRVLYASGLLEPQQPTLRTAPPAPAAVPTSRLWTPSEPPGPPAAAGGKKPVIWTP